MRAHYYFFKFLVKKKYTFDGFKKEIEHILYCNLKNKN